MTANANTSTGRPPISAIWDLRITGAVVNWPYCGFFFEDEAAGADRISAQGSVGFEQESFSVLPCNYRRVPADIFVVLT
jgi:hypothetical protein